MSDKEIRSSIDWDSYFFKIMESTSLRSKDPNTKVGAVIVNENKQIVGLGYNGFPAGFKDTESRWQRPTKYNYVVHAEVNAMLNSHHSLKGCSIYLPFWPCKDCCKYIAASGITKVNVLSEYYKSDIAEEIFDECGIQVETH